MTAISISKAARRPVQVGRHVRNGFRPVSEFQDVIAELAGHGASVRTKVVARHHGSLATGDNGSAIPNSATLGVDRTRARFAWHAGPYAQYLFVRFTLAPQNNGSATSPYVRLRVRDADNLIVGDAFGRGGAATGATDKPDELVVRATTLVVSDTDTTIVELTPDTDYFAEITEHDYGRLQSFVAYEVSLIPDTDNGYPSRSAAVGSSVLDADREDPTVMLRRLWRRGGAHLWNWWCDLDSEARNTTSSTYKNLIDDTSTTTTSAPGVRLNLLKRNRLKDDGMIPVVLKVYADDTDGSVRLVDSTGTTMLECDIDDGEGWYAVQGELPASDAKYLLHYGTSDDLTVYATSLYQCDTFEEWSDGGEALAIDVEGATSSTVGEDEEISVPIIVSGGTQTSLSLDVVVSYPDQSDPGAPTNTDLDGWTMSSSWSYDTGADEYSATFTKASADEGTTTLVFSVPMGAVAGDVGVGVSVESTEVVTPATGGLAITVADVIGFTAIPSAASSVNNGTTLSVTIDTLATGAQTNASFTVRAFINPTQYSLTPTTQELDGWSESGWSSVGDARLNTFTKASLADSEEGHIEFDLAVNGVGSVFIYTNNPSDGDPFTDQGTGSGDAILVTINPA